eukprot:403355050
MSGLAFRNAYFTQQPVAATSMLLNQTQRDFGAATKKKGHNDFIQNEKAEAKKYGIKRRFYDHLPTIARQLPKSQYRNGLTETDLEGYNEEVKQSFNIINGSYHEVYQARAHEIINIFGKHQMDVGNNAIQAAVLCEKVVSLLNHMRENHKDVSGLIRLQRSLAQRRRFLFYLKNNDFLAYAQVLKIYGLTDLNSDKGEGIHKNFRCRNWK